MAKPRRGDILVEIRFQTHSPAP